MDVLVVRHAPALDKDEAKRLGMLDRDRPLTPEGRRSMRRITRGLASRVPSIALLVTSPWRRAVETGDLLASRYGRLPRLASDALVPGADPGALAEQLETHGDAPVLAVVGHEPHLSGWVSWCLTGSMDAIVELRKGGACLLRFEETIGQKRAKLTWLMTPAALRRL
jgi:phosphohistidine phosphatase